MEMKDRFYVGDSLLVLVYSFEESCGGIELVENVRDLELGRRYEMWCVEIVGASAYGWRMCVCWST